MSDDPVLVRPGGDQDLDAIDRIQAASPEASQWDVREYTRYEFLVAEWRSTVAAFAIYRLVDEAEGELLNLAVDPPFRRRGLARRLLATLTSSHPGDLWLEVRESNVAAINLYKSLGFIQRAVRPEYYQDSRESAIVMNVHS